MEKKSFLWLCMVDNFEKTVEFFLLLTSNSFATAVIVSKLQFNPIFFKEKKKRKDSWYPIVNFLFYLFSKYAKKKRNFCSFSHAYFFAINNWRFFFLENFLILKKAKRNTSTFVIIIFALYSLSFCFSYFLLIGFCYFCSRKGYLFFFFAYLLQVKTCTFFFKSLYFKTVFINGF